MIVSLRTGSTNDYPKAPVPASMILERLSNQAPADHFTVGWLLSSLSRHSFGVLLLLLSVIAIAPGVAIVAGVLLFIPAFEMIVGRQAPVFPRRLAAYPLSTPHLAAVMQRAIPVLKYLEKFIHPRWPTPYEPTKRVVGVVVAVLCPSLVFLPIPLSGVVPAVVIGVIRTGLSRGGWAIVVNRPAGSHPRTHPRVCGNLGDGSWRKMDRWPVNPVAIDAHPPNWGVIGVGISLPACDPRPSGKYVKPTKR